jgi:uncharacterized protein GlcG (DUF336 family)
MEYISLNVSRKLIDAAERFGEEHHYAPLAVVVLDARGVVKTSVVQDGASLKRHEVAHGKAYGALSVGLGSRSLFSRAKEQPYFVSALSHIVGGAMVPVPGGVLIRSGQGDLVGAIGISGDTSDNDEKAAVSAVETLGFVADPGES